MEFVAVRCLYLFLSYIKREDDKVNMLFDFFAFSFFVSVCLPLQLYHLFFFFFDILTRCLASMADDRVSL